MTRNQLLELFPIGPSAFDGRPQDPISAITGGIGLVGNVVSGILGKNAATTAGNIQNAADITAANNVTSAVQGANAPIVNAGANASDLALRSGENVQQTAASGGAGATAAAGQANTLLNPYAAAGTAAAGTLQAGLAPGGEFNSTPTLQQLQLDPGYAFREQQAEQTLNRSAAARGGAISGSALKDLTNYSQGAASQEYQNAFNRYQTSTQNRYANLFGEQGVGLQASGAEGANLTNAAQYAGNLNLAGANTNLQANEFAGSSTLGAAENVAQNTIGGAKTAADYLTGGAASKAAGVVGGTNALTSGIVGGINSGTQSLTLSRLLQNPGGFGTPSYGTPTGGGYGSSRPYSGVTTNPDGSITVH